MAPKDKTQEMDEAEAFIRMQMDRNDERLAKVTDVDCRGFEVVKDGMLLQNDTNRYLLGTARATRITVDEISDKLDDTHETVKILVTEVRKSNGNGKSNGDKTIATWKLPIVGEVALRGFRASDVILIVLCVGLIVIGVKAYSKDGDTKDKKQTTSEEVTHDKGNAKD